MHATAPHRASPGDAADAARIAAAAADDSGALNDVTRTDLLQPRPDSATWLSGRGLAHVQRDARYTQSWLLGVAAERAEWPALLSAVADHVRARGGGEVTWWRAAASDADVEVVTGLGYAAARRQHEMRVQLPLDRAEDGSGQHADPAMQLRTFLPGDAAGVLEVNNTAFAGHPEQGDWTQATFDERIALPWFDPTLFVVAVRTDTGAVVGFNWLKRHAASAGDVARGEIYTIAVAPAAHGHGLGRRLAVYGLDLLHQRGFAWASLFVAADNAPAIALYTSLGFTTHRTDVALVAHVPGDR